MKRKIYCLLLVISMLLPLMPFKTYAASYRYSFGVKTGDVRDGGTDSEVLGGFAYYDGRTITHKLDSSADDHDKNDYRWYEFTKDTPSPWMAKQIFVEMTGSNNWYCDYIDVCLPYINGSLNGNSAGRVSFYSWTEDLGKVYRDCSWMTQRKITDYSGANTWGGVYYLDSSSNTTMQYSWNRTITDQYGTYNAMLYDDPPVMIYTLSNSAVGTGWLTFNAPDATQNASLSVNQKKLFEEMGKVENGSHQGIGSLTLSVKLAFPQRSTSGSASGLTAMRIGNGDYLGKEMTFTFYRSCFQLGNENISQTQTFSPRTDYNYINRTFSDVTITVNPTSIHCGNISDAEKQALVSSFQCTPSLYLGNSTADKLCNMTMTKSGGTLTFKGQVPLDKSGSLNDGVRLQLDNVSASYNGRTYMLESGSSSQSFYFSTHKVDTKAPTVRLTDVNGTDISIQNAIKQQHNFYLVSSETLYPQKDSLHNDSNQRYARYELYQKNEGTYGSSPVNITGYLGSGSQAQVQVPVNTTVLTDAMIRLMPASPTEGQYKLRIYGWDDANNGLNGGSYYEIDNIYIDRQAPRTSVTETIQNQAVDGSKRNDYTFNITDLQTNREFNSWARVYYCFVLDGNAVPDPSQQSIEATTGEMESVLGKWAFVEGGTDTATAVLKVKRGENFEGKLYYYTLDSSGNDSRTEQSAYFTKTIKMYNFDSKDTLITEQYTHPKNNYAISFDVSDANYRTEYRWVAADVSTTFRQDYKTYTAGLEVGSGEQTGNDGKNYLLDGIYTLEYKVTELRSGNWKKFTKEYVFDNKGPIIQSTWLTGSSQLLQNQQLKLDITDMSGVSSAAYQIVNTDGSTIDGYEKTPITITVSGDNRGTVNDTLTFSLAENGIYSLKIYATDVNGLESLVENLNFGIRNEKPQIKELRHNLEVLVDGNGATADGNYTLYLTFTDMLKNAASLQNEQDILYCISANGSDYGDWVKAENVIKAASDNSITYTLHIGTPLVLTEGLNTIYVKAACVGGGMMDIPTASMVTGSSAISILLDKQAPVFDLPSYSTINWTAENVVAVIKAADPGTGICTLTGADENIEISDYQDGQFIVTIKDNLTTELLLSDSLGNETLVPISVCNIDRDKPIAEAVSETWESGARTDGMVQITLTDKTDLQTAFALVKNPTEGYTLTEADYSAFDNASTIKVEEGEAQTTSDGIILKTYTIYMRGFKGTYAIGVKSTDAVGNTTETLLADAAVTLTDAEPAIMSMNCEPMMTKSTTTVTLTFNVPLVVLPNAPTRLLSMSETDMENMLSPALLEDAEEYSMTYSVVRSNAKPVDLYVKDESGRTFILTFTPDATFIEGFDVSAHIEKNNEAIENGGFISFTSEDTIYYIVTPSDKYAEQYFYIDDAEYSGLKLNEQLSVKAEEGVAPQGKTAFTKLCFEALHDGKTSKSARFKSYTLEGNEADRMGDEYISISVVDETPPTGSVQYTETKPTNKDVYATITMADTESGIIKCEKSYDGGKTYENTGTKTKYTEEFTQNSSVYFRLTNGAGMTSIVIATVANIDKAEITEGVHYNVAYTYENYLGEWVPITQGKAYRRVMATINPVSGGKILTATNNSGSFTKILTEQSNSFTFDFCDKAGNTAQKQVTYTLFDNQPGSTSWVLSNTEKTNKNIFATITITDDSGEIAFAEVKKDGIVYPFKGQPLENEYVVELDSSGMYIVTAYDLAGNIWTKTITVSNIDKTLPKVLSKLYSTPLGTITSKSVKVELTEFSKDISTIKMSGMEIVSGVTAQDIIYTPGDKVIRFKKNGSVAMKFTDEYGNEGVDIVTVSNICTNPPAIGAKAALASDLLSVNVTFEKMLDDDGIPVDPYRELSDLNVTYAGITYKLKDTTFNLKNNGNFEFFVHDSSGATQKILLTVTGIDDKAPIIKEVHWEYKYREENQNGIWEEKTVSRTIKIGQDTSGNESGYIIAVDENNRETNQNVNVTVTTDKETTFVGGRDALSMKKSVEYRENGLYNFNLQAKNGTSANYGVDAQLIDKTAPVITLANGPELIFIEGMTPQKDPMYAYDKAKLMDFTAYDMKNGKKIDLTDKVRISYGSQGRVFDPDNIENNEFVRSNPYYVEYTVYDAAGNGTSIRRTIRLVGFYDTIALINGKMPDSTNVATVSGNSIQISLKNFSGISYARYEKGIYTQGQMKSRGASLKEHNGIYTIENVTEGWYTVYVQTDKRDYFNITVYVVPKTENSQGGIR